MSLLGNFLIVSHVSQTFHCPLFTSSISAVLQIRRSKVESIMECCYSLPNIRSSHQASRCVSLTEPISYLACTITHGRDVRRCIFSSLTEPVVIIRCHALSFSRFPITLTLTLSNRCSHLPEDSLQIRRFVFQCPIFILVL
jgi:hypothetical protein